MLYLTTATHTFPIFVYLDTKYLQILMLKHSSPYSAKARLLSLLAF